MLHRSFKPAKCKTALKLATSRLKLMKNKKEVQLQQLKRELAKLLESGQDQTARIRVEHVVREEKTIAAYELLEIYCELIAARLPIIESQKNCPIDLKEAITSVVFASPRCSDIPELQEIHKHFTAKYGKEFISAAVELRPECGVSRMLVEKLSAKAPDGPTKIKILTAIAEEHNIKWDPKSFGEKELKPSNDLLNGPSTFETASRVQAERPIVQPPPSNAQAQAPPRPEQKHNAPINFEHNARSSTSFESFASTDGGGAQATMPAPYHPVERPSETRSERTEVRHSYSGDVNSFSSDRKHWNMEFKDATAAAQAAAEAAERASMAARAAADLSSRANISRQHSTESQKSNIYSARDEGPTKNVASKLPTKQFAKDPRHNFQDRNPRMQTGQVDDEHDHPDIAAEKYYRDSHGNTKKSSRSGSLRSSRASIDDDKLINDFQKGDRYSRKSSFEEEAIKMENSSGFSAVDMKKQSIGSEVEFGSSRQGGLQSDNFNYFAEEMIRKQTSSVSSHSHSSSHGDDCDVSPSSYQKFRTHGGEDPFVGVDQGNNHRDTVRMSSFSNDAVVFDDPVSDDDAEIRFDSPKYDREESKFYTTSPGRESPSHLSSNTDTWSPRQNMSGSYEKFSSVSRVSAELHSPPNFDESSTKSAHPPQPDEFLPVTFDESEGLSSETEDELDKSRLRGKTDPSSLHRKENIFSTSPDHVQHESQGSTGFFLTQKGDSRSNRNQDLNYSSDDEELVDVSANNNRGTEFSVQSQRKFGFDDVPARQSSGKLAKSQKSSNDMASEPFYDQVEERNSYLSPQTSRLSLVNEVKATNDSYAPELSGYMKDDELFQQSSLESGNELKFGPLIGGLRNKGYIRPPYTKSSSGDVSSSKKAAEDSVTAIEHSPVSPAVEGSLKSAVSTNVENKSSLRTPITDYDSDTDESEEELPQRNSRSKREPHSPKPSKGVTATSKFRAPVTFFDSDDNDSEEDLPKQTFNSTGRAGTGYSRRTKATPSSGTSSYSKTAVGSEASVSSDVDTKKTPSRSSYRSENPPNPRSQTETSAHWGSPPEPREEKQSTSRPMPESNISRVSYRSDTPPNPRSRTASSGQWGSPPEPRAEKQPTSRPSPESNMSMRKEERRSSVIEQPSNPQENLKSSEKQATSKPMPESNISVRKERLKSSAVVQSSSARENLKSSAKQATSKPTPQSEITMRKENSRFSAPEQRSSSPLTTVKSASTESPMSSTSSGEAPSRESSLKKASHVHPKLPDYDTIAAQLQSLRANR